MIIDLSKTKKKIWIFGRKTEKKDIELLKSILLKWHVQMFTLTYKHIDNVQR